MPSRASRTPLLSSLRKLISISEEKNVSRREFLRKAATASAVVATAPIFSKLSFAKDTPKIAIIGGGLAGLSAAYTLRKHGLIAQIYEANNRIGGRIFTAKNYLAQGLTTEFGGEFIDSSHTEMIAFAKEFGLELKDRVEPPLIKRAYFFGGKLRTEQEVIEAIKPFLDQIRNDAKSLPASFDYENPGTAAQLDSISLAEYFERLKISGWIKDLLEAAYVTEFGLELSEQSALNFITMIGTDISNGFDIFGSSDERYVISGGNSRIIEELSLKLANQVNLFHQLEHINPKGKGFTLTFNAYNESKDIDADFVILAIPFSTLKNVTMKIEMPEWKRKAISELGYGHHTKIVSGFSKRIWRDGGYIGEVFGDGNIQLAWDNSQTQSGLSGGMTSFIGGNRSINAGKSSIAVQSQLFIAELDKIFPGIAKTSNGKNGRFDWTNNEFSKGSYACYKPGQWTSIRGAEHKPVGNLFFAGEHCSLEFQGYMNGAAETGKQAALDILTLIK
jgi:monoamine oxidase